MRACSLPAALLVCLTAAMALADDSLSPEFIDKCARTTDANEKLACDDAIARKGGLLNKTIVPAAGLGNPFNKFWITPGGRVVWFFVSGHANEGIIAELNKGIVRGTTVLQYDSAGNPVAYGQYKGPVTRIQAPYVARARSTAPGKLYFSYSFSSLLRTKTSDRIEESEMTVLQVSINGSDCKISATAASTLKRNDDILHNSDRVIPDSPCTVTDGNN